MSKSSCFNFLRLKNSSEPDFREIFLRVILRYYFVFLHTKTYSDMLVTQFHRKLWLILKSYTTLERVSKSPWNFKFFWKNHLLIYDRSSLVVVDGNHDGVIFPEIVIANGFFCLYMTKFSTNKNRLHSLSIEIYTVVSEYW